MATLLGDETGAPATLVDALPAAPPRVSLLSSAIVATPDTEREWGNGIAYLPEGCDAPDDPYWWACAVGGVRGGVTPQTAYETVSEAGDGTKVVPAGEDPIWFRPFDIWDGVACTTAQFRAEDWQARARRALVAKQSSYIEEELWTGAVATLAGFPNDFLTNTPTIVGGGTLGFARALAELEQAGADAYQGRPAMIHAQPRLVSLWHAAGLVTPNASGTQLTTALGTIVVPGAGYDGSGTNLANGGVAATSYAYITGLVRVWLGPIQVLVTEYDGQTFDADFDVANSLYTAGVNDMTVRVERAVAYTFDPCLKHGVEVDHTIDYACCVA